MCNLICETRKAYKLHNLLTHRYVCTFTNMELTECKWLTHDGQAPDEK